LQDEQTSCLLLRRANALRPLESRQHRLDIAPAPCDQQDLTTCVLMPAIAATRLKGHIADGTRCTKGSQHIEPYVSCKIVAFKFLSDREK